MAQKQYSFLQVNSDDGLINNKVECIHKDSRGFIWFGTIAGLSRYDGHTFVNFMHDSSDSTSIDDHFIMDIQEDYKGNLWMKTSWKPIVYDVHKERFYNDVGEYLGGKLSNFQPHEFYCDQNKNIWLRSYHQLYFQLYDSIKGELVEKFSAEKGEDLRVIEFKHFNDAYYYLFNDGTIECYEDSSYTLRYADDFLIDKMGYDFQNSKLFVDEEGDIWYYGNYKGIYHFSATLKKWNYYTTKSDPIQLSSNLVRQIVQDDKGLIWIGTDHGGINILNKFSGEMIRLYNQPENDKSIAQNAINDLYIDNNNILWVATTKNGICYYHESIHKFPHYKHIVSDYNSLPYSDVNCFTEDKKGNLWIGTNGGGLVYFDREKNTYQSYRHIADNPNSLGGDVIVSLYLDEMDILWIGTYTGGLTRFDGKRFKRYRAESGNGLSSDNIWSIVSDNENRMWLGTLGGGVLLYDRQSDSFVPLPNKGALDWPFVFINQILKLSDGNMVIASANGLIFYNVKEERYKYHPIDNRTKSLGFGNSSVISLYEDSRGLLWIATREGVIVFDSKTDYVKHFTKQDGIDENYITGIQEDEFQSIWISTYIGLSQVNVDRKRANGDYDFEIINYTKEDGLQSKGFNANASFKTYKDEIIFGGADGFNIFQTKDLKFNKVLPKVVFTDLQVYNQSISPNSKVQNITLLDHSIATTKEIELKHGMNVFSIDIAALNFFIPNKTRYKYILEGLNDNWQVLDEGENRLTYANLKAGDYTLKVMASNNDGLWNEDCTELKIKVLPPFYATPIAYLIYILVIIIMIVYFRYSMLRKERLKFSIEQERLSAKRNHELDEMKLKFLTNVSHEFRTPLTLILTPVQKLLENINSDKNIKLLEVIDRNAKQLLYLVNQLLDFRKLELHGLRYSPAYGNIIVFLKRVSGNFEEAFKKKNINFTFEYEQDSLMLNFDNDKLQKVIMNLLSNALKFTPERGWVRLILRLDNVDQTVKIIVKDSGVGIKSEDIDMVFVRFYQAENNKKLGLSGSGIGLNLAKELVQLHNGTITVKSKEGEGASFTVSLPMEKLHDESSTNESRETDSQVLIEEEHSNNCKQPTLLLVEDNQEFRDFMKESLEDKFDIFEASDGQIGFDIVHEVMPDLIISDVMMPNMDGLELCQMLRKDIRTSHIPIILLTARTADEDKIKGFEIGVDDYITKPFNMDLLLLRINKILEKRSQMQNSFQQKVEINPSEVQITSMDEKLIKKAIMVVEENLSEAGFSVEDLSKELGMSRVYLYKKLLAITGKSPIEFMRIIRLKRGAQLLEKSQMTIAEVAYEVGFNNPRYFSKYFKEEYGLLPTAYVKEKAINVEK